MKKLISGILAVALSLTAAVGCSVSDDEKPNGDNPAIEQPEKPGDDNPTVTPPEVEEPTPLDINLSADGYAKGKIGDFSVYENTSAYRKVKTAEEFITAIKDAKYNYKNVWDENTNTYTQQPADGYTQDNFEGKVHVIEIENDLNLGYYKLSSEVKSSGIVDDFAKNLNKLSPYLYTSDMVLENGMSQIKVENISNLLIYSKNGAKLTHCGFKLTSDNNVVFRNLQFDEMWQWEDGNSTAGKIGDYDWYGWAYFKIAFCGYVWIDHCSFGKSYDGQIDYSNPDYTANAGVNFRAPYGADGKNGLHISWCNFNAGSDDPDGYIYKMMQQIEDDYQTHKENADANYVSQHAYYDALRNKGASFEDILYGLAIPQKKGFLCGDSGNNKEDYEYNLKLQISFSNCKFTNLEDRLPKIRGGNAFAYNCIVDSSQYYSYRSKLKGYAAGAVTSVNKGWKCALVSQGIVCGNGGSFKAENCIFKGIETLLKNNDSNSSPKVDGGYQLVNCSYQAGENSSVFVGSSSDTDSRFTNSSTSILKTEYFNWHTEDGTQPYTVCAIELDKLAEWLDDAAYGSGAKAQFGRSLLKSSY
ncbi:MAG: hypothetical protein K2K80_00160 [Clostridia bacterium]|nr:hypothetical protein [Clostridia bacterium]